MENDQATTARLKELDIKVEAHQEANRAEFAAVHQKLDEVRDYCRGTRVALNRHSEEVGVRFAEIHGWFDAATASIMSLGARLDGMDSRFDGMDARFDGMDARFDGMDARFDGMDSRLDGMDARFEQVDARFEQVDARFEQVATKEQVEEIKQLLLRQRDSG